MSRTAQAVKEAAAALNQVPALTLVNNQPRASSVKVAACFGKRHDNVLRQIKGIMANCPESFSALNFEAAEYTDEQGKLRPYYSMTKDGFTVLAWGFTGAKAMKFKLEWLEAFNAMEAELAGRARDNLTLDGPSTPQTRKPLVNLVNTWARISRDHPHPTSYRDAWRQVRDRFQVERTKNLTLSQVKEACAWVRERIAGLAAAHNLSSLPNYDPAVVARLDNPDMPNWEHYHQYAMGKYHDTLFAYHNLCREIRQITGHIRSADLPGERVLYGFLCQFEEMARAFPDVVMGHLEQKLALARQELRLAKIAQAAALPETPPQAPA